MSSLTTRFATDNFTKVFTRTYGKDTLARLSTVGVDFGGSGIAATSRGFTWNATIGALDAVLVNGQASIFAYNNVLVPQTLTTPGSVKQMTPTASYEFYQFGYARQPGIDTLLWRGVRYDSLGPPVSG